MEDVKEEKFAGLCWLFFWRKPPGNKKGGRQKKWISFVRNQTWKKAGKEICEYYSSELLADKLFPS